MQSDTAARKRRALELLALGATMTAICTALIIKRHKIRLWKETDEAFRRKWNDLMLEHGRTHPPPGGGKKDVQID